FPGLVSGRTEARTESHPPWDPGNTRVGDPPRENRVFRTVGAPADSIRGLLAELRMPPRRPRAESTRAPTDWRCHGGGTPQPPPRFPFPTRPQPPSRKRIRKACLLLRLLLRPLEPLRYLPTFCTARRSSEL